MRAAFVALPLVLAACTTPEGITAEAAQRAVDPDSLAECADEAAELEVTIRRRRRPGGRRASASRIGPCVERAVRSWRFDAAPGPSTLELPVVFEAE